MEKIKTFIIIFILIASIHVYLFANLKMEDKIVIAPKVSSSNVIFMQKVILKKAKPKTEPIVQETIKEKPKNTIKKLPKTKSKNKIKEVKKKIKKKRKKVQKKKEVKKTVQENVVSPKKNITKKTDSSKLEAFENKYLLKLKKEIEKNKEYPSIAKRLNQTGKVYLNFTIKQNGEIINVKIAKKTKFKRLNNAALEILSNIQKFDPIPKELNKTQWTITVPIVYKIFRR